MDHSVKVKKKTALDCPGIFMTALVAPCCLNARQEKRWSVKVF